MARDEFSRSTIERLAKRVGMKCSNPDCRTPTAGPNADGGVTNLGVAAHITAASPLGPRYDAALSSDARADIANGIWLCQNCAKRVDDDELSYTSSKLKEWKDTAEHMAALESRGYSVRRALPFAELEIKAPKLFKEMRNDLQTKPLIRQFVLLKKRLGYNVKEIPSFVYYYEDYDCLDSIAIIMLHYKAAYESTIGSIKRYTLTEEFVHYLIGNN